MATTFDVIYLGTVWSLDPIEGNDTAEDAGSLVGWTFGSVGDPLADHIQSFAPGTGGFSGGVHALQYEQDNFAANENFTIDGGPDQTFDSVIVYNATITYTDGTTDTITANVVQDTTGNLYLVPELTAGTDQIALEAKPIRSLTLDSVNNDTNTGLSADRDFANFAVCFSSETAIRTPRGERLIDDLRIGDLVSTMDNGPQPIRWIGRRHISNATLLANPRLRPILIPRGVMGATRNLLVSSQHGMLLGLDHLVRAKHLIEVPKSRVRIAHGRRSVTYMHLMFDAHQIIFAEGSPAESFYPGPMALHVVDRAALAELRSLFPEVCAQQANSTKISRHYGNTARLFLPKPTVPDHFGHVEHAMT
ncbi:MAG TPA: hemolysin [Maritimibacter sp.]|nr:hemolysin [Maritimibacter sp.]